MGDGRLGLRLLAGATADLRLRKPAAGHAHSIHFQVERVLLLFGEGTGLGLEGCPLNGAFSQLGPQAERQWRGRHAPAAEQRRTGTGPRWSRLPR